MQKVTTSEHNRVPLVCTFAFNPEYYMENVKEGGHSSDIRNGAGSEGTV